MLNSHVNFLEIKCNSLAANSQEEKFKKSL